MKNLSRIVTGAVALLIFGTPFAFADTPSVTIQSLSPGTSVFAKNNISFSIAATGFSSQLYGLSDSFPGSSASASNIDPGGKFSWTPNVTDVGAHTFTITVSDYTGGSANVTQTVTVLPPPSISIQSVSPGNKILAGTKFSFTFTSTGFTNPTFSVGDSFSGSSVANVTVNASGNFSWTPAIADNGEHTITINAYDSLGHSNSASVFVLVGAGPSLAIPSVSPSANVSPGQTVSFNVNAINFVPTAFTVSDTFTGVTTVSNGNITMGGSFSWTPSASDVGTHILSIKGVVGAYGQSATTTQTINVLGPGGSVPEPTSTSTAPSTSVLALQAQLAQLLAKIAGQSSAGSSTPSSSSFTFSSYLRPGVESDEVTQLQLVLSQQGFFSGTANGYYGPMTTAGVKKFQSAHGLSQLGVVGPATRAALNALSGTQGGAQATASTPTTASSKGSYVFEHFMGYGDTDPDVIELQQRLVTLGFLSAVPTGFYGSATEAAVKKYQSANHLPTVGYVDMETRAILNK